MGCDDRSTLAGQPHRPVPEPVAQHRDADVAQAESGAMPLILAPCNSLCVEISGGRLVISRLRLGTSVQLASSDMYWKAIETLAICIDSTRETTSPGRTSIRHGFRRPRGGGTPTAARLDASGSVITPHSARLLAYGYTDR